MALFVNILTNISLFYGHILRFYFKKPALYILVITKLIVTTEYLFLLPVFPSPVFELFSFASFLEVLFESCDVCCEGSCCGMVLIGIGVVGMVLVGIGVVGIVHEQFGEVVVVEVVAYLLMLFLVQGQDYLKADAFFQIRHGCELDLVTFD